MKFETIVLISLRFISICMNKEETLCQTEKEINEIRKGDIYKHRKHLALSTER